MDKPEIEIIVPKKPSRAKTVVNLSASTPRAKRKQPQKKPRNETKIISPLPIAPASISKRIDDHIIDNTKSTAKRATKAPGIRESNFLLTFVPNSSVRKEVNPKLFKALKAEITSFTQYIMDPANLDDILKPAPGNDDPKWFSKVIGIADDKVAAIEDSKDTNKRLHTHIYLPIRHRTKVQLDLDKIRQIAQVMLEPLGISGPRVDAKVEKGTNVYSAKDYVEKLGKGEDGTLIK